MTRRYRYTVVLTEARQKTVDVVLDVEPVDSFSPEFRQRARLEALRQHEAVPWRPARIVEHVSHWQALPDLDEEPLP